MTNFTPLEYADACDETKEIYSDILATLSLQSLPNWVTYMGNNQPTLKGFWQLYKTVIVQSSLPRLLIELVFFSVAYKRTSKYCMALHAGNVLSMLKGFTYKELARLVVGNTSGVLPYRYKVAMDVCIELIESNCSLPKSSFESLVEAGFTQFEAEEITSIVGVSSLFNLYTFASDLPVDHSFKEFEVSF